MEIQKIGEFNYSEFKTEVLITKDVKEFFKENEDINLTKDFDSDSWYQGWLLKYLDKDKDAVPDLKFGKYFQLIYCGIIQNPEDFLEAEDILEKLKIEQNKLIFDGSTGLAENNPADNKTKFWVRWIVVRK